MRPPVPSWWDNGLALSYSGASDNVAVGNAASLQNLQAATILSWSFVTSTSSLAYTYQKSTFATGQINHGMNTSGASSVTTLFVKRATASVNISTTSTNFTTWGGNKWLFLVAGYDITNGVAPVLVMGDLGNPAAVAASYNSNTVGSGAKGDDSAHTAHIGNGNQDLLTVPFPGYIGMLALLNRQLTLGEILDFQYDPRPIAGCVGFWMCGADGPVSVLDRSGLGNTGTITGAVQVAGPFLEGSDLLERAS